MSDQVKRPDRVLVVARDPENPPDNFAVSAIQEFLKDGLGAIPPDGTALNTLVCKTRVDLYQLVDGRWSFVGAPREARPFRLDDRTMLVPIHEKHGDREWTGFEVLRLTADGWRRDGVTDGPEAARKSGADPPHCLAPGTVMTVTYSATREAWKECQAKVRPEIEVGQRVKLPKVATYALKDFGAEELAEGRGNMSPPACLAPETVEPQACPSCQAVGICDVGVHEVFTTGWDHLRCRACKQVWKVPANTVAWRSAKLPKIAMTMGKPVFNPRAFPKEAAAARDERVSIPGVTLPPEQVQAIALGQQAASSALRVGSGGGGGTRTCTVCGVTVPGKVERGEDGRSTIIFPPCLCPPMFQPAEPKAPPDPLRPLTPDMLPSGPGALADIEARLALCREDKAEPSEGAIDSKAREDAYHAAFDDPEYRALHAEFKRMVSEAANPTDVATAAGAALGALDSAYSRRLTACSEARPARPVLPLVCVRVGSPAPPCVAIANMDATPAVLPDVIRYGGRVVLDKQVLFEVEPRWVDSAKGIMSIPMADDKIRLMPVHGLCDLELWADRADGRRTYLVIGGIERKPDCEAKSERECWSDGTPLKTYAEMTAGFLPPPRQTPNIHFSEHTCPGCGGMAGNGPFELIKGRLGPPCADCERKATCPRCSKSYAAHDGVMMTIEGALGPFCRTCADWASSQAEFRAQHDVEIGESPQPPAESEPPKVPQYDYSDLIAQIDANRAAKLAERAVAPTPEPPKSWRDRPSLL